MVFPVLLGGGRKLFGDGFEQTALTVVESKPSAEVVLLTLRPKN